MLFLLNDLKLKGIEMSVVINIIREPQSVLYDPDGKFIGVIESNLELLGVRVQIKEQQLTGYMVQWEGYTIHIDRNGNLDIYPDGFYTDYTDLLLALV